jgi:hypothetical protein
LIVLAMKKITASATAMTTIRVAMSTSFLN